MTLSSKSSIEKNTTKKRNKSKEPKETKESSKRSASHATSTAGKTASSGLASTPVSSLSSSTKPAPSGYLLTCDIPLKQFILKLNDDKMADQKFVLEDIDEMHLLIDGRVREEIRRAVDDWMDENIWSSAERVGENLGLD